MKNKDKSLFENLWECSEILSSKMDANEYKNYLAGLFFFKYYSDSFLMKAYDIINVGKPSSMWDALEVYTKVYRNVTDSANAKLINYVAKGCSVLMVPELTFKYLARKANNNELKKEDLKKAFEWIEKYEPGFENIFDVVDLDSIMLGTEEEKQNQTISDLIKAIDKVDFLKYKHNEIEDAFESLMDRASSEASKKASEFYTPQEVSQILARIAVEEQKNPQKSNSSQDSQNTKDPQNSNSSQDSQNTKDPQDPQIPQNPVTLFAYDPCMGSASLLLNMKKFAENPNFIKYFGQELVTSTYNLARMNMYIHNVKTSDQTLRNGDTLDTDWPVETEAETEDKVTVGAKSTQVTFGVILMNPPFAQKWNPNSDLENDPRFADYGIAPKSKSEYAFLLHGYHHLKNTGTMTILLPHGVLFRGAVEGEIRRKLLEEGAIYAVIGLPANLFYNTSIPTCILVLKKERKEREVLFIDGSKFFTKGKKQNRMTEEDVNRILTLYKNREDVDKEAHLATFEEIEKNNFNLNITRYIDTFDKEPELKLGEIVTNIETIENEIKTAESNILSNMSKLADMNKSAEDDIKRLKKLLGKV